MVPVPHRLWALGSQLLAAEELCREEAVGPLFGPGFLVGKREG